jgi:protein-disulfide isomerase
MRRVMKIFVVFCGLAAIGLLGGAPGAQAQAKVDTSSGKNFGSKAAPVTMEVFSDFQCPACRALYEQTLKELMSDYVASGKVYLVHHDFPLPMHKYSRIAARYANAAAHIGKYEQVEAALFDNQAAWSQDGSIDKYVAAAVGPTEMKRIDHLMEGGCKDVPATPAVAPAKLTTAQTGKVCALDATIDKDVALGQQSQVNQTPTFVISGHGQKSTSSGVVPYATLKQYFDYLISH